jgi:DNA replication protein DnaC
MCYNLASSVLFYFARAGLCGVLTAKLVSKLALVQADGSYLSWLNTLIKHRMLILDDFGTAPMKAQDALEALEVVKDET